MHRITLIAVALVVAIIGYAGELPDPQLTPGVSNPDVTQDSIQDTICAKGFTKKIRPPANYTNRLKKKQLVQYGYKHTNPKAFEEDHLIPLGVGGNPTEPKNLWPQPKKGDGRLQRKTSWKTSYMSSCAMEA